MKRPGFQALRWLATDNVADDLAEEWREPAVSGNTLAFLQYTSGSTAAPKGVMVSHSNLLHNSAYIKEACDLTADSVAVTWLPPFHDMGLIDGIIQPLYTGFPCFLMPPQAFLQRPVRWLQAISRYRAIHSGGPNFAYELCIRKITPEQCTTLDLSSWCSAYNGAEPIRKGTLERFAEAFGAYGFRLRFFYPCYGLAEATLMVSGGLLKDEPVFCTVQAAALEQNQSVEAPKQQQHVRTLVGCGRAIPDTEILIVRPELLTQCSPGEVGEIWVSGPSVAQGYWNRPEETEQTFWAYLADTGEGPFLRTGDLGFLKDGELFVTGRLKDLIIVGGRNHYPQDIELTVEQSHPALRSSGCAAFSVDVADEECLVVVAEVERHYQPGRSRQDGEPSFNPKGCLPPNVEGIVRAIRRAVVEEHDVRVHTVLLLKAGSIPKTSSGKIQRHACRAGFLAGTLTGWRDKGGLRVKSQTVEAIEAWLISKLSELLEIEPHEINVREPLASYGLDSMGMVSLSGELGDWLGQRLSPGLAYDYPTIEALAQHLARTPDMLEAATSTSSGPIPAAPENVAEYPHSLPMPGEIDYTALNYHQWSPSQRLLQKIVRTLLRFFTRVQIEGQENFPTSGPFLLAINHIYFWLDAPLFFSFVPRRTVFFAADRLQRVPFISWFLTQAGNAIYVARGKGDLRAIDQALTVLRAGGVLGIAPEGTRSHSGELLRGYTGIAYLAAQAPAPILPAVAYGQEQAEAHWRRLRRVPVHVRVGSLIEPPSKKASAKQLQAYTDDVMATLAQLLPPQYRGTYTETAHHAKSGATAGSKSF
jgi:1-acyl-sn-glycerol-3-phosphate acyltransferase